MRLSNIIAIRSPPPRPSRQRGTSIYCVRATLAGGNRSEIEYANPLRRGGYLHFETAEERKIVTDNRPVVRRQ